MTGLTFASVAAISDLLRRHRLWRHDATGRRRLRIRCRQCGDQSQFRRADRSRPRLGVPAAELRPSTVHPGAETQVFFRAVNHSAAPVTARAVYNVTPAKIGIYFDKLQCFCFSNQTLAPGAEGRYGGRVFCRSGHAEGPRHPRSAGDYALLHDVPGGRCDPASADAAPAPPARGTFRKSDRSRPPLMSETHAALLGHWLPSARDAWRARAEASLSPCRSEPLADRRRYRCRAAGRRRRPLHARPWLGAADHRRPRGAWRRWPCGGAT